MSFSLVYLINRFLYRIAEFLRHWYVNAFTIFSRKTINYLERLDKNFALRITLRHWLKPLYQDYTFIGYVLGVSFRTLRIIFASALYLLVIIIAIIKYIIWAVIPPYIVIRIFIPNFL